MVSDTTRLWFMNLYPGGRKDKKGDTSFNLCLEEGIVAIGWSRLNLYIKTNSPERYVKTAKRVFQKAYKTGNAGLRKWHRSFERLSRMKNGDLVWTKRSRGHYYLNRIGDAEVTLLRGRDYVDNDFGSARGCDWNEVLDDLEVPAEVKRNTRGTIHPVKDPKSRALAISQLLYNDLKGDEVFRVRKFRGKLLDYLSPEDVEDLVGLYLQAEKNLVIVPSTSKQSTSPVEFLMLDRETGEEAGVQVKTGNQIIKLDDYKAAPKKTYFFQQRQRPRINSDGNHIFVENEELQDFARTNPNLLPTNVRRLIERLVEP